MTSSLHAVRGDVFRYVLSCDLDVPVRVQIGSLEGALPRFPPVLPTSTMVVSCTVRCNGRSVGCPVLTSFARDSGTGDNRSDDADSDRENYGAGSRASPASLTRSSIRWNQWLTMPVMYSELSKDAALSFHLWDVDENSIERRFIAHATIPLFSKWAVLRAGMIDLRMDATPPPRSPTVVEKAFTFDDWPGTTVSGNNAYTRQARFSKQTPDIAQLMKLTKDYEHGLIPAIDWLDRLTLPAIEKLKNQKKKEQRSLFLMIRMARVQFEDDDYAVVYFEKEDSTVVAGTGPDPELGLENLVELKHQMMTRNVQSDIVDRALKPDSKARDALELAIQAPSSQAMSVEQRDLIWKYRYSLSSNRKALTKFVRSVHWDKPVEAEQAVALIREWTPIDAEDALELLAPMVTHAAVRRYAVSRLHEASNEHIRLYLPQLVQALKYENIINDTSIITATRASQDDASGDHELVEETIINVENGEDEEVGDDLAGFLLKSAVQDSLIANDLYWYLKVEVEATAEMDIAMSTMYAAMQTRLRQALLRGPANARRRVVELQCQQKFVDNLVTAAIKVSAASGGRAAKEIELRRLLNENAFLTGLPRLVLPVDPTVRVTGVNAQAAALFNSNLMPMKLTFNRTIDVPGATQQNYVTIFKRGDDLRQDQLVIQMIRLMDKIMRDDNLDLRLTPYSVLATSVNEGFVQFIKAYPLRDVISQHGTIHDMMRSYRPSKDGAYGIEPAVLDNYVRSCAGYSIICYILGIGDRHLHNLLLRENGCIFHVDFGFILGRDPKPLPPPMKLTTEMINAMGGFNSKHWQSFRSFCFEAFKALRRHANLILNLFSLMLDAGIPDIAIERDKAVQKIEQRFHLELSDEQADQHVQRLIESSVSAKMPILIDFMHDVKQWAAA